MRRLVLLVSALTVGFTAGCGDPCEKLAEKICKHVDDKKACERSRKDMEDFTPEMCKDGLEVFDRLYEK